MAAQGPAAGGHRLVAWYRFRRPRWEQPHALAGPLRRAALHRPLLYTQPSNGISDSAQHVFRADGARHIRPPAEPWEAERIEWVPLTEVRRLIDKRDIVCGTSMNALLYLLTEG
ncbi:hypothetical protein AB0H88_19250 [Nonomuraea sp. NPDC050680]|uniref:hypothetical protein n=1 Tax=Nonomuraea sp. NPDC050680 TaxID=3154630 RepID=UPI0034075B42